MTYNGALANSAVQLSGTSDATGNLLRWLENGDTLVDVLKTDTCQKICKKKSQECTTSTCIRANFWAFFFLYFAVFLYLYTFIYTLLLGRPCSDVGAAAMLAMMTNETRWPEAEISWSDP